MRMHNGLFSYSLWALFLGYSPALPENAFKVPPKNLKESIIIICRLSFIWRSSSFFSVYRLIFVSIIDGICLRNRLSPRAAASIWIKIPKMTHMASFEHMFLLLHGFTRTLRLYFPSPCIQRNPFRLGFSCCQKLMTLKRWPGRWFLDSVTRRIVLKGSEDI